MKRRSSSGVALVVTLMMMSVLVMMVVGLAGVMRNEQAAARNLTYQVLAQQMAEIGVQEAMATVLSNSPASGTPTATGPGWILNRTSVPLFSLPQPTTAGSKNLEQIGTNSLIVSLSTNAAVRGSIPAGWVEIRPPGPATQPPIGRYAWWVDDEGTKLNLNAVGPNNTSNFLPLLTNFPYSADHVFSDPSAWTTNTRGAQQALALRSRSNAILTPELIKDTNVLTFSNTNNRINAADFRQAKGGITAWSSSQEFTPWGTARVNLNTATEAEILAALTNASLTNIFGPGQSLARKYGGGSVASADPTNHGGLVMKQIARNILFTRSGAYVTSSLCPAYTNTHTNRFRGGLPATQPSSYIGPYLEEVRVRVDASITNGGTNLSARLGISLGVVNPYRQAFTGYRFDLQPRKFRVLAILNTNFADTAIASSNSTSPLNGFVGPISGGPDNPRALYFGPEWYTNNPLPDNHPWPLGANFSAALGTVGYESRTNVIQECTITLTAAPGFLFSSVSEAYVMLDQARLLDPNGNVVDWVSLDDFSQADNYRNPTFPNDPHNNGQMILSNLTAATTLPGLSSASFGPGSSEGLRKVDPRARFSLEYWNTNEPRRGSWPRGILTNANGWAGSIRAWTRSTTPVFTNTGISYLEADPAPGVTDVTNHPHFVTGFTPTNGIKAVAQLGAIHTGIPWRTLRLQPISQTERSGGGTANHPPDWVVLEMFTATNPSASRPLLNPNGIITALAGTGAGVATNSSGTAQARIQPFLATIAVLKTNLRTSASNDPTTNGVPISLTNAALTNWAVWGSNLVTVLTNPRAATGWATNAGWATFRAGSNNLPANGFLFRGELLEVGGIAESGTLGEDVIEGRLRAFLDLLTTRSDTFSVWSIGQGLAVNTNASPFRTNVMGEIRRQTVFQRVPQTDANGAITNHQVRVLYSREHTLE